MEVGPTLDAAARPSESSWMGLFGILREIFTGNHETMVFTMVFYRYKGMFLQIFPQKNPMNLNKFAEK